MFGIGLRPALQIAIPTCGLDLWNVPLDSRRIIGPRPPAVRLRDGKSCAVHGGVWAGTFSLCVVPECARCRALKKRAIGDARHYFDFARRVQMVVGHVTSHDPVTAVAIFWLRPSSDSALA